MSCHGGGGEDGGDSGRWLVSYADFITLLMILFVVMYSMGQTDLAKFKALSEGFEVAFYTGSGSGGAVKLIDAGINSAGGALADGVPDPIQVPGIPKRAPASVDVAGELSDLLSEYNLSETVSVQTDIEGTLLSLSERIVFTPGTLELQPQAYAELDNIIEMLNSIDKKIKLVGHTDNTPPVDSAYADNFDLSVARAKLIANYLIDAGVSQERIIIEGRGQYEPVFENDTDEHRLLNSRVDIVIMYNLDAQVISGESPLSPDAGAP